MTGKFKANMKCVRKNQYKFQKWHCIIIIIIIIIIIMAIILIIVLTIRT
jgi:uncharacterized membrane protein YukC